MSKQPFMPLFFGDFLAATAEWSGEERALYLLLLSYQWSMGSLPTDTKRLAKLVDYERRAFEEHWPQVSKKFVERDDRLYNLRLETHRERSIEIGNKRSNAGKTGAAKRWQTDSNSHADANGKDDGKGIALAKNLLCHPSHPIPSQSKNPVAEGAVTTTVPLRARALPDSPSMPETDEAWADAGCDVQAMCDWLAHKRSSGKPLPAHAQIHAAQILRGMGDANTQRTAVRHAIANNWQSLRVGDGRGAGAFPGKKSITERLAALGPDDDAEVASA